MKNLMTFFIDCGKQVLRGGKLYWAWIGGLTFVIVVGLVAYGRQIDQGLVITGMSDQVSWGIYIANFTFLVGVAAAAVMLVIPAYIFHNKSAKQVVLLGEGVAVAACVMCMLFVTVDLGSPERFWHMLPIVGRLNWPMSILSWDVIVLFGYLLLNLCIPMYVLYRKYQGREPTLKKYFPWVVLSIFWAISIHTVTAFLLTSNPSRPFWHTALLAPRFIASAFTAGPAFIILVFLLIDKLTDFNVEDEIIRLLAVIVTIAQQINLFMLGAELFTEFYSPTQHSASAQYLFFGLGGGHALQPWIYTAVIFELIAVTILTIHSLRARRGFLVVACVLVFFGVWVEKGMGLIIPGFIPTPLGEVFQYFPTLNETLVSLGIWAIGFLVLTVLAKASIPIETGHLVQNKNPSTRTEEVQP